MSDLYEHIYKLVKQIPKGKVTTYGILAMYTGNPKRSRIVGVALSKCNDTSIPCHRVIRKDGSLPGTFGIGGQSYQKFLLKSENIEFLDDGKVNLSKHLWLF